MSTSGLLPTAAAAVAVAAENYFADDILVLCCI